MGYMNGKLVFAYAEDKGIISSIKSSARKVVASKSQKCALCTLTYGPIKMKPGWREFIDSLDVNVEFLHRDEFRSQYTKLDVELPAAFHVKGRKRAQILSKVEIEACRSLDDLIWLVSERVRKL